MNFNLVSEIEYCYSLVQTAPTSLIYYSHIPAVVIAFLIGCFVLVKNKNSLEAKVLFSLSLVFSIWVSFNLILWTSYNSQKTMFFWSFSGLLISLLFVFSLYLSYVFISKKDVSMISKLIIGSLILPMIVFTPTDFNLQAFSVISDCEAIENAYFTNYYYALGVVIFAWIFLLAVSGYMRAERIFKRQIILFAIGIEFFLLSFFTSGFISSLTGFYELEFYGVVSMAVFMGFIAYLIVQYKAFNIKLIGAQALVVALILLVGSQFFFAKDLASNVLTGFTLVIVGGIGIALIRSVKYEVERKEELQVMADKLATANDALRKLDNAKTEFISIASHQLRTPITAIKGFASLLLEGSYGKLENKAHDAVEKMYGSSERLVNLIEDLLNVSRIESGRMQFSFEKANVDKVLKELVDNFILIAKSKKFYLELKPSVNVPEVAMDSAKIKELISNFIDNALKYTEKGGVTISSELREKGSVIDENGFVIPGKSSEFGKVVRITVSDTGIGIPKEEIPYLFKKFSRGKDVSRLHVGGTGLGLYVGKAIAEAHNGAVWVESDGAGLGSRFIIEIPVEHVA